jgi:flagellar hook-associated protein 2
MATVSSLGVGSGLNSEGIISALMAVERKPIDLLTQETTGIKTQLSSIGKLQSLVAAMRDKAGAISSVSLWGQTTLTSADTTVVSGSSTNGAAAGRYSVTVQTLAASQTATSGTFASSTSTLNEGTMTIELGSWSGSTFTGKSGATPVNITIGAGETSLASIRDKINAAGAGVTATIVNDANGARLSLRSAETGKENGFRITATETTDDNDPATGLSALGYDAAVAGTPMTLNQAAANATATVNGIAVESTTNTLSGVADGVTLTLGKVSASPVEVTVEADNGAVSTAINDFVSAFNDLANYIKDQTKYNADAKTGGPLQGDRTVIGLQWQLRGVLNQASTASSTWSVLSEVGIAMKSDGTLGITSSKLSDALEKPDELRKLLATDGSDVAGSGFMDRFKDIGNTVLGSDGSLETLQNSLNAHVKRNDDRQSQMEDRLTRTEARIRAQYEALDTSMAKLNALSSYVTQQMASLATLGR